MATPKPQQDTETVGARATRVAQEKAKQWIEHTYPVIIKSVTSMAEQGLFHCTVRFEDPVPSDPVNQSTLVKLLARQNLSAKWKQTTNGAELVVEWGPEYL